MAVNKTPGQSASGFRLYIDRDNAHDSATIDEIHMGTQFFHKGIQYTVKNIKGDDVYLEGYNGAAIRTSIVDIHQLTKSGSDYKIVRI